MTGLRGAWWGISDVKAVLITHGRGDHKGLAKRVREQSGAWVAMHEADVVTPDQFADQVSFRQASDEWLGRRGSQPADFRAVYEGRNETAPDSFDEFMLQPDRLLVDGERPLGPGTSLVSVWTPGHTPGHVCFADRDRGVLLTGDHILPRITPNISPSPFETGNVLGQYLDSLAVTPDLPRAEVLPAHEPVHRAGRPGPRPPQAPREAAGRGNDRAAGPAGQHHRPGDRDASVEQALGADAGPAAAVRDRRSLRSPRPPGPDWLPNQLGNRRRCLAPAPCGRAQAGLTYEHRGASPSGRSTD